MDEAVGDLSNQSAIETIVHFNMPLGLGVKALSRLRATLILPAGLAPIGRQTRASGCHAAKPRRMRQFPEFTKTRLRLEAVGIERSQHLQIVEKASGAGFIRLGSKPT